MGKYTVQSQINNEMVVFFASLKFLTVKISAYRAFRDKEEKGRAHKLDVDNPLVWKFHFDPDNINIPLEKARSLWNQQESWN